MKKGIYPYEYMSSWGRFWETTLLPIEVFYNQLTAAGIIGGKGGIKRKDMSLMVF
jgi:hypothetical protein